MAITFIKNERIILITIPQTTVTIQELLNAARDYEDDITTMDIPHLVNASGKENLGGGVLVGITLGLLDNWRVKFEDRCSQVCNDPSYTGSTFVQCAVTGGNIVAINDYNNSPIAPSGCTQVTITSSSSATIAELEIANLQRLIETQRRSHTGTGDIWYWDPIAGDDSYNAQGPSSPGKTFAYVQSLVTDYGHDIIVAQPGNVGGPTVTNERITITKNHLMIRGPGRDFKIIADDGEEPVVTINGARGVEVSSMEISSPVTDVSTMENPSLYNGHAIHCNDADNLLLKDIKISEANGNGILVEGVDNAWFDNIEIDGVSLDGFNFGDNNSLIDIKNCHAANCGRDGISFEGQNITESKVRGKGTSLHSNGGYGLRINSGSTDILIDIEGTIQGNAEGEILDEGINTHYSGIDYVSNYNNTVEINVSEGVSGTNYPRGTAGSPVNNLEDALTIATQHELNRILIDGNITATASYDLSGFVIEGINVDSLIILAGAGTTATKFKNLAVSGTITDRCDMEGCVTAGNLYDFRGKMISCHMINSISIASHFKGIQFINCYGYGDNAILDINNVAQDVSIRNFSGSLYIRNLTTDNIMDVGVNEGLFHIENSCTAGQIIVQGVGRVYNSSTGTCDVNTKGAIGATNIDLIQRLLELQKKSHPGIGNVWYWNPNFGNDEYDGTSNATSVKTFTRAHDLAGDGNNDIIVCMAENTGETVDTYDNLVITKGNLFIRGPGRPFRIIGKDATKPVVNIKASGVEFSGVQIKGAGNGWQHGIYIQNGKYALIKDLWIHNARNCGVYAEDTQYTRIDNVHIESPGRYFVENPSDINPSVDQNPSGAFINDGGCGLTIVGNSKENIIENSIVYNSGKNGIAIIATDEIPSDNTIRNCISHSNEEYGLLIDGAKNTIIDVQSTNYNNVLGNIKDDGINTIYSGLDHSYHYNGEVVLYTNSGHSGTNYPRGTSSMPINNLTDAITIVRENNLNKIIIRDNITINSSHDISELIIKGECISSSITLDGGNTLHSVFEEISISGTFNGRCNVNDCVMSSCDDFDGIMKNTFLLSTLALDSSGTEGVYFINCYGYYNTVLDANGINSGISTRDFHAKLKVKNITVDRTDYNFSFSIGRFIIDSSCTAGTIKTGGIVVLINNSGGSILDDAAVIHNDTIADHVWEELAADHIISNTMGGKLNAATTGGVDYEVLSAAVWNKLINPSAIIPNSYGDELVQIGMQTCDVSDESLYSLSTTVDNPIAGFANIKFTMADGIGVDNTFDNCIIAIQDKTDNHIEMRRITNYVGVTQEVTLDRILSFDVENGDVISISKLSYGGATGTGGTTGPRLGD